MASESSSTNRGSALVSGGGSGLGAATARRLAADGFHVVVFDRDGDRAAEVAAEIGGEAAQGDVADEAAVGAAVDTAARAPGDLRVAVNCAGIVISKKVVGRDGPHDLESFERVIRVNLIGTFNVLRLAAAAMNENEPDEGGGRGVIVNTASTAAFEPQIGQTAYGASKGAVVTMTFAAARDLASRGIRVVAIAPGAFGTPMLTSLPAEVQAALGAAVPFPSRLGHPNEFADLVSTIVHNQMLNGNTIRIDGALRMAPR